MSFLIYRTNLFYIFLPFLRRFLFCIFLDFLAIYIIMYIIIIFGRLKMFEFKTLKLWLKLTIIFGSILIFLGIALLSFIGYMRLPVWGYYKASEKSFLIPGLKDDFVPQGMCYDKDREIFILGGYSSKKQASPLYIVDKTNGRTLKEVRLATESGKPFKGHAGGVAIHGDYMYIAGGDDRCLYVYSYPQFLDCSDGGSINCLGKFSTKVSDSDYIDISFVTTTENSIIVGEFYREKNYPTLPSHKLTTSGGDFNQALAIEFPLTGDEGGQFGINPTPIRAYSLTDQVQGLAINDGKIYLSTSYGLAFSHVLEYDLEGANSSKNITALGTSLPLCELDSSCLIKDYKIAPMSEEIVFVDGKLYTMCESASNKYIFGKITGGKWCYSTDLTKMK